MRIHAQRWRRALAGSPATHAVANADDPLVVWAAGHAAATTWVATGQRWRLDAASCPECGSRIVWDGDEWRCSSCTLARPRPDVTLDGDVLVAGGGHHGPLRLQLPGRANRANAAMAAAGAATVGVDWDDGLRAMTAVTAVAGRYQVVDVNGTRARLLLAKNPAGWAEALDLVRPAPVPVVVGINARIPDGRDPSWLWDVPFERLRDRLVVATGDRGRDVAVRLRYAEVDHEFVPDYVDAIRTAGAAGDHDVDIAANYTSFQDIRKAVGAA